MWYIADIPIVERNYGLVFSLFFFTTLAVLSVTLRIITRTLVVNIRGLDDYLIVAATVRLPLTQASSSLDPRLIPSSSDQWHF